MTGSLGTGGRSTPVSMEELVRQVRRDVARLERAMATKARMGKVSDLDKYVKQNLANVATLMTNVSTLQGDVSTLQGDVSGLAADVDALVDGKVESIKVTTFTADGTFTRDPKMLYCLVECLGSGGSGGTAVATGSGQRSAGQGGGGGGYGFCWFTSAQVASIGATVPIVVGVGGSAGSNGSPSRFNADWVRGYGGSAGGGRGPSSGNWAGNTNAGGPGGFDPGTHGLGGGGHYGSYGGGSLGISGVWGLGGDGGDSAMGFGGRSEGPSTGYGAGGAGRNNSQNASALVGLDGTDGLVRITEYLGG